MHAMAEVRKGKKWGAVGDVFPSPYGNLAKEAEELPRLVSPAEREAVKTTEGYEEWRDTPTSDPIRMRNYRVFALLAGVRNWKCPDGKDAVLPIAEPKGVAKDASRTFKKFVKDYGSDGHSHSYLSLDELVRYPWMNQTILFGGFVDADQYKVFKRDGRPEEYCQGVGGSGVRIVENAEMESCIAEDKADHLYTKVTWREGALEYGEPLTKRVIPLLLQLVVPPTKFDFVWATVTASINGEASALPILLDWFEDHDLSRNLLEDVRICFFFDN